MTKDEIIKYVDELIEGQTNVTELGRWYNGGFKDGVQFALQKLQQCNVGGSLPPLGDEIAATPIQDALYATGKFTTDDCSTLADGILQYIKDAKMIIVSRQ